MSAPQLPSPVDLKAVLSDVPAPLEFVLPGLLRGTVGALVSPGGMGKSYWALGIALAISMGRKVDQTGLHPTEGRVLVLAKEDPMPVLAQRIHSLVPALPKGLNVANFDLRSCVGLDIDLMADAWLDALIAAAAGCRLAIFDTLTRFHKLDENSALDMGRLIARMEHLALKSQASVLFLHHTSKASAVNGQAGLQQAARGSSVLVDNARWSAYLTPMTDAEARAFGVSQEEREAFVRWNISKQNYGPAIPDVWYRRAEGGALQAVTFPKGKRPVEVVAPMTTGDPQSAAYPEPARPASPPAPVLPSARGAYDGNW